MKSEQQYIDLYEQNRELINAHSTGVMNAPREEALDDFRRLGFPSRKVERYKYTDIDKLFAPDYGVNLMRLPVQLNPYKVFSCGIPNLSTSLYFVVNDVFYKQALPKAKLPEGVTVGSLRDEAEKNPDFIARYYGKLANAKGGQGEPSPADTDAVTALNTMLAQDGLVVHVGKNVKVPRAIQVVNILRSDVDLMANRRVLIIMDEGAEATLLFCDDTADDRHFLTTQVIEAFVGPNASLDLYCLEETTVKNTRVSNVYVSQQRDSRLHHSVITLHNGVTRNQLNLTFHGEGAECWCNGCVIADKQQHVDNNTLIDHAVGHCTSHELYKYVLDDHATGAFAGRVLVRHGSQKTSSDERNQNLVMTRTARMYTQPMLEIYADDVKCSHGSTVGQLNDAARFYMQQRCIDEHEANLLLESAFVGEVIDQIKLEPLKDRLRHLVEKRFRNGGGEICSLCTQP